MIFWDGATTYRDNVEFLDAERASLAREERREEPYAMTRSPFTNPMTGETWASPPVTGNSQGRIDLSEMPDENAP